MTKNLEIRTVEHNGIKIRIKIDYDKAEGSILDFQNGNKNFVFANRGLEYMNGWLNIVDAIKFAMKEIQKELEWCLAESSKFRDKEMGRVEKELVDLLSPFKPRKIAKKK